MAARSAVGEISAGLAAAVEAIRPSIVRVDDGTRLTATGIIWSADGVIVSTSHGVERDEDLAVELDDGARHAATLVGRDPDTDIAVLRVESASLVPAAQAPADNVRIGQIVLALGRPGSRGLRATVGIISSRQESETGGQAGYVLTTDAGFYPGFSGGPLVDVTGQMVGMNNVMFGRGGGVSIGTPVVAAVAASLLSHGRVQRAYLGVSTQTVSLPESAGQPSGALVVRVEPGSPAEKAGLVLGDTLLSIEGDAVEDVDALRRILRAKQPGSTAAVRILRGGEARELSVTLGAAE